MHDKKVKKIREYINDSVFNDLYNKILSSKVLFQPKDVILNWELLKLKFELILLQDEYYSLLLCINDNSYKKIKFYESEISRLSKEINVITNEILLK